MDRAIRLLACSVIVLAGFLSIGLAASGPGRMVAEARDYGSFALLVGGLLFIMEYFRGLSGPSESERRAQRRVEQARELPKSL